VKLRAMEPITRADLHVHSTASETSKLGVQRTLGLPECATPPEEVYALAKRRGMDFVTITDHDTIDGALEIADRPDVFVSEELTAGFAGEPHQVHVLVYGITPDDHARLQERAGDVEAVAAYLHEHGIACALAHPFYAVAAPLEPRHRRRLAELFGTWEVRNGARAPELNLPAATYIDTHGGTGIGGTDDHAGVDIGRTWTQAPAAATPREFLDHLRAGRVQAGGDQGSAAKWAHAAMALSVRALGRGDGDAAPDPAAVLRMVERVMREGDTRSGELAGDLGPDDARALLRAWLAAVAPGRTDADLLAWMQSDDFSHRDLARRAKRCHERALQASVGRMLAAAATGEGFAEALMGLFGACVPAIPYAPAAAFLGRERHKLADRGTEPARVALVADGIGMMHGVTNALAEIRERGVPGFEVELVGTDMQVDRRLSAVAEVEVPHYPGLKVGVPSPQAVVEALADGRYGLVHVVSPGPAGVAAALTARVMELPLVGSYHTELAAYAQLRSGDPRLAMAMEGVLGGFYGACDAVLSPSAASDARLYELGVDPRRVGRWDRGVDLERFDPARRADGMFGGPADRINVLYAGRLTVEKGVDLLARAFCAARARDPRLHLLLAGDGPEGARLAGKLGRNATFLGWLAGDELARAYASADVLLFPSRTDTFGQVVLEAQASGLPVVAVRAGGPAELIESGRSGLLCPPDEQVLGAAVAGLAASPAARERLRRGGLASVRSRTWDAALGRLAAGWTRALAGGTAARGRRAA
jgi:glycosyltransferase involved in cell wall biosynthesis/predicted metal-dependent phosphoesterase TrpH